MSVAEFNRVLVVDDDPEIIALIQMSFELVGGSLVDAAHDGAEALELIDQNSYDLILLDVLMPKVGGMEVLQTIRQRRMDIPVVLVTSRSAPEHVAVYYQLGATGVIAKPFDVADVYHRIVSIIENYKG